VKFLKRRFVGLEANNVERPFTLLWMSFRAVGQKRASLYFLPPLTCHFKPDTLKALFNGPLGMCQNPPFVQHDNVFSSI
jgi:hypothetical protein